MDSWQPSEFTISGVFGEFLELAEAQWLMLAIVTAIPTIFYTWVDMNADSSAIVSLGNFFGLAVLYLQVFVLVRLARNRGILAGRDHEDGSPTLGMYFRALGQSILWSIGVFLGLVLLVLPGVWLMTIWFVVLPVLIVENENVMDAFGRSKELVTPYFWLMLAIVLIVASAYIAAAGALFLFVPFPGEGSLWSSLPLNLALQLAQTAGWVLSLATYIQLAGPDSQQDVGHIFA